MEFSPFISGWGKRGPDRQRGLLKATQLTRSKTHLRARLLSSWTALSCLATRGMLMITGPLGGHESGSQPGPLHLRQAGTAPGSRRSPLDEDVALLPPGLPGAPWPRHPHLWVQTCLQGSTLLQVTFVAGYQKRTELPFGIPVLVPRPCSVSSY